MILPDIWQRYLERNVGTTPKQPRKTLITQRGEILLDTQKWAPFTAEQIFEAQRCEFVWHARVRMAPLVTAVVEDAYEGGHGRLEAKLFGLFRIMRAEPGLALDRGELIRYLGELPWNPTAIVHNPELHFTMAPSGLSRVWAHDEASYIDCRFNADGDLVEIETTTRVRGDEGPAPWSARYLRYGEFEGVRIPVEAEVSWDLPEGRSTYWRGHIESFTWQ
jgi:hypothetical protein